MASNLEKARSFIGRFVVLNAVGLRNREDKMRRKEGIVTGVESFPEKIEGLKRRIIHYRCLVEWSNGIAWTESPDNLKVIVREVKSR